MKKLLSLLLALLMVLSVFSVSFAEDERETLTVFVADSAISNENTFTTYIEDNMNVNLDITVLPDAVNKIDMMILAGEKLADVICIKVGNQTAYRWAQSGAVIPMTPYFENPEFNANLVACEEIVPGIYDYIECEDGNYYSIPFYQRELHSTVHNKMWMNTAWLEELNLEVPTNLDEFYNVLVAFKEAHPDCYPILGSSQVKQGDFILWIMNSFIYDDNIDHLNVDENGQLSAAYVTDMWKEALIYVRKLVDEGLYPVECFTMDRATTMTEILRNGDGEGNCNVGMFLNGANNLMTENTPWWPDFDGIAPLEGPYGTQFAHYTQPTATNCWFVTKDCENPDLAAKVGIWMFDPTEEVWVRGRYGVEGEHRLAPTVAESCYEGFPALFEQIVDLWPLNGDNQIWRNNFPGFCWLGDQGMMETGDPDDWIHKIPQATTLIAQYTPDEGEYVPVLLYTAAETEQINNIRTDLRNWIDETKVLFVTREMSIEDDWDEYIETCWDIGLQEFLDVSQACYDRMTAE